MTSLVGEVLLDLLEQDRLWKTQEGRVILVEELEPRHRANVLAMLERRAPDLHLERIREFLDDGLTYGQLAEAGVVLRIPPLVPARRRPPKERPSRSSVASASSRPPGLEGRTGGD